MNIIVFFTDSGVPKTGLSPTIRIRKVSDGSLVVTDEAMAEIGDGFYKYDFTAYDETEDYTFRADGGSSLSDSDRYKYGSNFIQSVEFRVKELWMLDGLDSSNPMTVTQTSRTTGSISQTFTGDGETTTTVTRM